MRRRRKGWGSEGRRPLTSVRLRRSRRLPLPRCVDMLVPRSPAGLARLAPPPLCPLLLRAADAGAGADPGPAALGCG